MKRHILLILTVILSGCAKNVELPTAILMNFQFNGQYMAITKNPGIVPAQDIVLAYTFSQEMNPSATAESSLLQCSETGLEFSMEVSAQDKSTLIVRSSRTLPYFKKITLTLCEGDLYGIHLTDNLKFSFVTEYDPSDKMPRITTEELLDKVQLYTFKYFWDHAHPDCGLARERANSGDTVTIGGSGFGLICIPAAVNRGFITMEEAATHVLKAVTFLEDKADRFHGAFPHWLNGKSGKTHPFSTYDNGADLIETAFLIEGLLTLRQFFSGSDATQAEIRERITRIWEDVEWDWFTRDGSKALYWHWSPDHEWHMNMTISGWNEGLIAYVLGASSPTHPISAEDYHNGWARDGAISGGSPRGPLFFAHYSFLGLDPRGLEDRYANYWELNRTHALTNYQYCANSKHGNGYSSSCWGLTASDYYKGYTASSPSNDTGTIAPTAALASMPYTPEESIRAMEYFYYVLGDRLWGEMGFHDAFTLRERWFAQSYLAIDQGPIVAMIENYRSGLLWNLFMKDPDIQKGLELLEFKRQND